MIEFTVTHTMSEEEWCDHVFGSGADQWPWWISVGQNSAGDVVIYHQDPDSETYYEDEPEIHYTTLQKLADTASEMAPEYPAVNLAISNDDFDADAMDLVLQMDVFGEIVYG
jgi:hypothetical protein